jgi:hypothetical protein
MRKLKLMADYGCYPLWEIFSDGTKNVNPNDLPISSELINRLYEWADQYDQTLNREDPISSGFDCSNDERIFGEQGLLIFKNLQNELTPLFEITYYIPEVNT